LVRLWQAGLFRFPPAATANAARWERICLQQTPQKHQTINFTWSDKPGLIEPNGAQNHLPAISTR
jgi:hypothetical protein